MLHIIFIIMHIIAILFTGFIFLFITIPAHMIYAAVSALNEPEDQTMMQTNKGKIAKFTLNSGKEIIGCIVALDKDSYTIREGGKSEADIISRSFIGIVGVPSKKELEAFDKKEAKTNGYFDV